MLAERVGFFCTARPPDYNSNLSPLQHGPIQYWTFGGRIPGAKSTDFQIHWETRRMPHGSRASTSQNGLSGEKSSKSLSGACLPILPSNEELSVNSKPSKTGTGSMRVLIAWMVDHGFHTFTDLDQDAQQRFISVHGQEKRDETAIRVSDKHTEPIPTTLCTCMYLQGLTYPQLVHRRAN